MTTQTKPSKSAGNDETLPETFHGLVDEFMPTLIESDAAHKQALAMVRRMMNRQLNTVQRKYLRLVAHLAQDYARAKQPRRPKVRGRVALELMMEEHDLSGADVARLLSVTPGMVTRILKGERAIGWEHAKVLAQRFAMPADVFMEE